MDIKIIDSLNKAMPTFEKPGPGKMKFKFIRGEDVIERLNSVFAHEWSSEVKTTAKEEDHIIVCVKLTVPGEVGPITKEGFGGAPIARKSDGKPVDMGNSYKSAFTGALKKAAEQLGIGLKEGGTEASYDEHSLRHSPAYSTTQSTAVVSVRNVEVESEVPFESSEMKRAKELLKTASASSSEPFSGAAAAVGVAEPERITPPVSAKPPVNAFGMSNGTDPITSIQESAIMKLCATAKMDYASAVAVGVSSGSLGVEFSDKGVKEITKEQASKVIRYLSTRAKEGNR